MVSDPAATLLPVEVRSALHPAVPLAIEDAIGAIADQYPDAARSDTTLAANLRRGVTHAVERWFRPTTDPPADLSVDDLHVELGRAQARAGRSLVEMMGFYRIGARIVWRRLAATGSAAGLAPELLYQLAELGFGSIDELSTQAAAGYAEEQSHQSGASQSRRAGLVRMLLRQPQPPVDELLEAGRAAGIALSSRIALFVASADDYDRIARAPVGGIILGPREDEFVGVVLDPNGPSRRRQLAAATRRARVSLALGPTVSLAEARLSLADARALRRLVEAGLVRSDGIVDARSQWVGLLLGAAPQAAREMVRERLGPLDGLGTRTKENLEATLHAWLRRPGERKAIAHELGVHPQTVRYRVARLRELFGSALDDPEQRFELELAFRLRPFAQMGDSPPPRHPWP